MSAPALWTVDAMAEAMGAERQGALPQSISGLSIDSRTMGPGEAFFAIAGDHRDGHDFVADRARRQGSARRRRRRTAEGFPGGRAASGRARMCLRACAISPSRRGRACRAK